MDKTLEEFLVSFNRERSGIDVQYSARTQELLQAVFNLGKSEAAEAPVSKEPKQKAPSYFD